MGLRVRIPPGSWMPLSCEYRVLSLRVFCAGPITRPEKSYRLWCVLVWFRNLSNKEALGQQGLSSHEKSLYFLFISTCCFFYYILFLVSLTLLASLITVCKWCPNFTAGGRPDILEVLRSTARSKAWVCSRSFAENVSSNPADALMIYLVSVVRQRSLRRTDQSSTRVLPSVVCECECDCKAS